MKSQKITRTYKLEIKPNLQKFEAVRYSASRYRNFLKHFICQIYFNTTVKFLSTKDMGSLANKAQKQAIGIVAGIRAASKATGNKSNCPEVKFDMCPGTIIPSKKSSFGFWVSVINQMGGKPIKIPAKSHRKLNEKLRGGWELSKHCEVTKDKNGKWSVLIFVTKKIEIAEPRSKFLGVDVGLTHCVARSDGYLGKSGWEIIRKAKIRDAERRRQGHVRSMPKSSLKQQLDIEARRAVNVSLANGLSLAVEDPKSLANLRSGKLHGWARGYFARRAAMLGQEEGVFVGWVNPYRTSQTCSICGNSDKLSRVKLVFKCTTCGNRTHADINAARVIALKGEGRISKTRRHQPPVLKESLGAA